jgi:hypothetical protein
MVSKEEEEIMDDLVKKSSILDEVYTYILHILGDPGASGFPGPQG